MNDPSPSRDVVLDTDCLNFLLSSNEGRKILRACSISIPRSVHDELGMKERGMLEHYTCKVVDLHDKDREYAARLLVKINQRKEVGQWYMQGRKLGLVRNTGECECAALSRAMGITLVLLDKDAKALVKKAFQHGHVPYQELSQFCLAVLRDVGTGVDADRLKKAFKDRLHKTV
nr:hypothetical protein [Candidatus Sigynarchaeota archaeon]